MMIIKAGWLILAFLVYISVVTPYSGGQASILQAVTYQLTDGIPKTVGSYFR